MKQANEIKVGDWVKWSHNCPYWIGAKSRPIHRAFTGRVRELFTDKGVDKVLVVDLMDNVTELALDNVVMDNGSVKNGVGKNVREHCGKILMVDNSLGLSNV